MSQDNYQGISELFAMSSANLFSQGGESSKGEAVVTKGVAAEVRIGVSRVRGSRKALYPNVDVVGALAKPLTYGASTDFSMTVEQAAKATSGLLSRCSMDTEGDAEQYAFIRAMQLCMAMNSASILMPGRAEFWVGKSTFNFFADVMTALGNDGRRYFRAYADETRDVLKELKAKFEAGPSGTDEDDDEYLKVEDQWMQILRVAEDRGLGRAPTLVHDSADACTGLTATEKMLLRASKKTIFETRKWNAVDNPVVDRVKGSSVPVGAVSAASDLGDDY